MPSLEEKIRAVAEEIKKTPVNKATEAHLAKLKARLARLKEEMELMKEKKKKSTQTRGIRKVGDATVVVIGPPSVGKSSLVKRLTNIETKIGEYAFTTTTIVSGMMEYKNAKFQLLDVPGLIAGAQENRGRGREILSWARMADILLIMVDIHTWSSIDEILDTIHSAGIRINQNPPDVKIVRKDRGSIQLVKKTEQTHLEDEVIKAVLREYGIINAEVVIGEDLTLERLVDAVSKNRTYPQAVVVVNKIDLVSREKLNEIEKHIKRKVGEGKIHFVSVNEGLGLENLIEEIHELCGFIRVYTKKPGKKPNMDDPLILKKGSTIRDVCERISNDMVENFRYARVFGSSAKFDGQRVGLNHVLDDGDVVEIHSS